MNIPFHPATQIRVGLDAPAVSYAAREGGGEVEQRRGSAEERESEGETGGQREERRRMQDEEINEVCAADDHSLFDAASAWDQIDRVLIRGRERGAIPLPAPPRTGQPSA